MNFPTSGKQHGDSDAVAGGADKTRQRISFRSRLKTALLLMLFVLVLAGLGIWSRWARTGPSLTIVPLIVDHYDSPGLGLVPYARADAAGVMPNVAAASTPRPRAVLLQQLEALKDQPEQTPVVVYCKGWAARDDQGAWRLLPADADPLQPTSWLPLRTILEKVHTSPAKHKLVVFDLAAPPHGLLLGMADDDVAAGLAEELTGVPDADRLVLCTCAPGQTPFTSGPHGMSLFASYWRQGLEGAADGHGGLRDGTITVHELTAFVQARVERAAGLLRQRRQTPTLLGTAADFPLRRATSAQGPSRQPLLPQYPEWLLDAWRWCDGVVRDGRLAGAPRVFQQMSAYLVRAEQAWRGGEQLAPMQACWTELRREAERQCAFERPQALSLAQETANGRRPAADRVQAIATALGRIHEDWSESKKSPRWRQERLAELKQQQAGATALEWETAAWTWLATQEPPAASHARLAAEVAALPGPPRYRETVLVQQLAELAQRIPERSWPADLVGRLVRINHQGESMLAGPDLWPRWREPARAALQAQHDGMVRLMAHGFADSQDAHALLQEAETGFAAVAGNAQRVRDARRRYEEARLLGPWLALGQTESLGDMVKLGTLMRALRQAFIEENISLDDAAVAKLQQAGQTLTVLLHKLGAALTNQELDGLLRQSRQAPADAALAARLEEILAAPTLLLTADQRLALNEALRDLDGRLLQQMHDQDAADDRQRKMTLAPAALAGDRIVADKHHQAIGRARAWIGWLSLADLPADQVQAAQQTLAQVEAEPTPGHWAKAEAALRAISAATLPGAWDHASAAQREWLLPFFPPLVKYQGLDGLPVTDAMRRRREEERSRQAWLADWHRYQAREGQALAEHLPGFAFAARFHEKAARDLGNVGKDQDCYVTFRLKKSAERLTATQPVQPFTLEIQRVFAKETCGPLSVALLASPASGLAVGPTGLTYPEIDRAGGAARHVAPLQVAWRPSKETTAAAPGLLARASFEGRSFHAVIPVTVFADQRDVRLLVSANPREPEPALSEIRLQPGAPRQTYFIYVENLTEQPRTVTVDLRAASLPLPGGSLQVRLEPRQTRRLVLGDALTARQPLLDCTGPLVLQAREAGNPQRVLDAKTIPFRFASALNPVQVAKFQPLPATPVLRLVGASYVRPSAQYPLKLEVAGLTDDASLEVGLVSTATGKTAFFQRFPQAKQRRIGLGQAGGLVVEAHEADWTVELDTRALRGRCRLQARLVNAAGQEIRMEQRDLIIDDDAPRLARLTDCPAKARQGTTITVRAQGRDDESGIAEAVFFVGRSQGDQVPEETVKGQPLNKDQTLWSARLELPKNHKGPLSISVRFVNGVGLARSATHVVEVTDIDPELLEPGRIAGQVLEGSRPQPGLAVVLRDERRVEKARTVTRPDGTFTFSDVPAGRYQLWCVKPETGRRALVPVVVSPSRTTTAAMQMSF